MLTTKNRNDVQHGFVIAAISKRHGKFDYAAHLVKPEECLESLLEAVLQDVSELIRAGEIHTVTVSSINIPVGSQETRKEDLWNLSSRM